MKSMGDEEWTESSEENGEWVRDSNKKTRSSPVSFIANYLMFKSNLWCCPHMMYRRRTRSSLRREIMSPLYASTIEIILLKCQFFLTIFDKSWWRRIIRVFNLVENLFSRWEWIV